ncbi:MAG TPA: hypothetical protein VFX20_09105 [Steroidobacteraceae bacterium]|nr:hypothetical protein [Steroidobacteraceae bacterium]
MATAILGSQGIELSSDRSREHRFFCGMSLLIALVIFVGFARTYFLAGLFHAKPLPAPIVHIHGAIFSSWVLLLVTQTSLTASGRADIHRRLGLAGLALAPLIVVLGVLVANEMLGRFWAIPSIDAKGIYAVALSEILGFALPVTAAFCLRCKPAFHKRLILIGTIAMTTAGFGRWPVDFLLHKPLPAMLAAFSLLLPLAVYDLLSMRRVHRATAWGGAWVVLIELTGAAIGHTAAWGSFATHMHSFGF